MAVTFLNLKCTPSRNEAMKTIIPLFFALFSITPLLAQYTEGVVTYKEEIKNPKAAEIRKKLEERGFNADIPDTDISKKTLYFNATESIYKQKAMSKEDKLKQEQAFRSGGKGIKIMKMRSDDNNAFYRQTKENKTTESKTFMGKQFLIETDEDKIAWKVTGRAEKIGQYQVLEAVSKNGNDTIQAWFTPQIPVSTGPHTFGQLPGLILLVNVNQGEKVYSATSFDLRSLTAEEQISQPKKGKKVTKKQYKEIVKQKTEEMKKMYGEKRAKLILD